MNRKSKLAVGVATIALIVGGVGAAANASSKATYYVALGDSLAWGAQPVGAGSQGYPEQLHKTSTGSIRAT
jgi:hypothetical protein